MTRSADEIARILEGVRARQSLVTVHTGEIAFQSLLREIDPRGGRIVLERSPAEAANTALLARSRCTFHAEMPGWHLEFVAIGPRELVHEGKPAIQCSFPEVLVSYQRRAHQRNEPGQRNEPKQEPSLRVLADAGGITPFTARIVDIALGGIGFLLYSTDITLEPGTLLHGCQIELPGAGVCVADLEVRYSQVLVAPDGRRAMRSGCRFVSPTPEVMEFVRRHAREPE